MTPPRQNVLSFFFLISYWKMHSGERKDFSLAAITVPHKTHGTYLNVIAGELKGPSSYAEQTTFDTTHHVIRFTILL